MQTTLSRRVVGRRPNLASGLGGPATTDGRGHLEAADSVWLIRLIRTNALIR